MDHSNRRRRSVRARLTAGFVTVALGTVMIAYSVLHFADLGQGDIHSEWNFRILLLTVPVAAIMGALTSRIITRSLSRLHQAVERFDLRAPIQLQVEGDDEVADLARAFNRMVERLAADERSRRELFADVAHELRHPLAVLTGRLELMQDGVVPLDPEQLIHLQEMVLSLNRLVGDLRDLSLAEVGRLSLHRTEVDLASMIAELAENMEPVASAKSIRLSANVAPNLPRINADADRIRQVLVNLIANGLQYTPPNGQVSIEARLDAGQLYIAVSDTGPGIAAADLPHLFDRFYRTDKARTRATGGTGLGLAIVRSLVTLHGGQVTVQSEPGQGSRFSISLPIQQP